MGFCVQFDPILSQKAIYQQLISINTSQPHYSDKCCFKIFLALYALVAKSTHTFVYVFLLKSAAIFSLLSQIIFPSEPEREAENKENSIRLHTMHIILYGAYYTRLLLTYQMQRV